MRRGDLVTIALSGDFGKPRPALIIQSDQFAGTASVTVLLLTSTLVDAPLIRLDVEPRFCPKSLPGGNGLCTPGIPWP
ncbi:type II toxin-antitoxin system PemK/MazF family toxin [Halomonas cerina]|uniref:type II toxin-antitoxin system PemK/MazF family toxin n=1 Tax=Halomonas cerina TaxID=447424 RepID=UPI00161741C0